MPLHPDRYARHARRRATAPLLGAIGMTVLLAGCAGPIADTSAVNAPPSVATYPTPVSIPPISIAPVALPEREDTPPASDALTRMLAYAQHVRLMHAAELGQEVARLGAVSSPTGQMQLSLVLSQLLQLAERIRAQELLARVLANPGPEAQALHPLAALLASRHAELRRLEEQLEKQTQQTREVQRRLDQTMDRLEALKAIERSLTNRSPAASSSAPANRGNRTPSP